MYVKRMVHEKVKNDPFNSLFFHKPVPEGRTILDFNEARDDEVAVASAGPYANHLHFAPAR